MEGTEGEEVSPHQNAGVPNADGWNLLHGHWAEVHDPRDGRSGLKKCRTKFETTEALMIFLKDQNKKVKIEKRADFRARFS